MIQNPWRYNTPPGWSNIQDAPRDGTVIEIQNNYGVAPTWSICRWQGGGWERADNPSHGVGDGPWLSWRAYEGEVSDYIDPTNGQQDTADYWRLAVGLPPEAAMRSIVPKRAPEKRGWLARLFAG